MGLIERQSDLNETSALRIAGVASSRPDPARVTMHRFVTVLVGAVAFFCVADVVAYFMWSNQIRFGGMAMLLFDMDTERNLPTWFSTVLLAFLAMTAWHLIPRTGATLARGSHVALALVLLFLSADEASLLHERFANLIEVEGTFARARWILLWLPLALLVGFGIFVGLWRSSRRMAIGLVIGAIVYLTGAVGLEALNTANRYKETSRLEAAGVLEISTRRFDLDDTRYGKETWTYTIGSIAEEGFEMGGLIIWCVVLCGARATSGEESESLALPEV